MHAVDGNVMLDYEVPLYCLGQTVGILDADAARSGRVSFDLKQVALVSG
jgi:hypothetical protein